MSVGRSALGVLSTNLLNLVLSIGNSIFLTRTLGVVGKGEFAVFTASFGLLSLLLGLGLDVSLRYFVAQERVEREKILTSLILFVLITGGLVFAVARLNGLFFTNELFLPLGKQRLTFELTLAGVVVANLFHSNVSSVFAGCRSFKVINIASIGFAVVSLATWFGLFAAKEAGIFPVGSDQVFIAYLVLVLANAVVLGVLAFVILGVRPSRSLMDRHLLWEMVHYGSKAFASQVAQFLNYRIDIWIVQIFLGAASLGLYSLAGNLAMMLWILPRSLSSVLMPATAAKDPGASMEDAARMARLAFVVTLVVGIPAVVASGIWIRILYGAEFGSSAPAFCLLMIGCVPFSICVVLAASLAGVNRVGANLAASGVGLVVTIVLDVLLIPRYGIGGAAVASSASYLVTTIMVVVSFSRYSKLSIWRGVVPQRGDLTYVIHGLKSLLR